MHLACANLQMGRPGQGGEREQLPALGWGQTGNLGTAKCGAVIYGTGRNTAIVLFLCG